MAHLLTPEEAAELLHMDARTIVAWSRKGYLPCHPIGTGKRHFYRYFEAELLNWIEKKSSNGGHHD